MQWLQTVVKLSAQNQFQALIPGAVLELPTFEKADNPWWPFAIYKIPDANKPNMKELVPAWEYPPHDPGYGNSQLLAEKINKVLSASAIQDTDKLIYEGGYSDYAVAGVLTQSEAQKLAKYTMADDLVVKSALSAGLVTVKVFDALSETVQSMAQDIFNMQAEIASVQNHLSTPAPQPADAFSVVNDAYDVVQKLKALGAGFEQVETEHVAKGLPKLSVTMSFNPKSKGVVGALINAMTGA